MRIPKRGVMEGFALSGSGLLNSLLRMAPHSIPCKIWKLAWRNLSLALCAAIALLDRVSSGATDAAQAAVLVKSPDKINVLKLEPGQPRLYDSNPLRTIEKVSPEVAGWQFISIPQRNIQTYEVRVRKAGVIYVFGGASHTSDEKFLGGNASGWEPASGVISGINVNHCLRRTVAAGETLQIAGFELQIAAESIALTSSFDEGKGNPPAMPKAAVPPSATPAAPDTQNIDPLIGRWKMGRNIATFATNGLASRMAPNFREDGKWTKKGNDYELNWGDGREVEVVRMHSDSKKLVGKDSKGRPIIVAEKVVGESK